MAMARYTPAVCSSTDVGMMCSSSRITIGVLLSSRFKYYSLPLSHKHIVLFVNSFSRTVSEETLHVGLNGVMQII